MPSAARHRAASATAVSPRRPSAPCTPLALRSSPRDLLTCPTKLWQFPAFKEQSNLQTAAKKNKMSLTTANLGEREAGWQAAGAMFAVVRQAAVPSQTVTTTATKTTQGGSTTVTITYPPFSTEMATPIVAPGLPTFSATPVYAYPSPPIAPQPMYPLPATHPFAVGAYGWYGV